MSTSDHTASGTCDIAIIGGGVVGMSLAHGLAQPDRRICIFDEGDVAFRASRGNFALVWVQGKGAEFPDYARWSLRSSDLWPQFADDLSRETGITLAYERPGGFMPFLDEDLLEQRLAMLKRLHNQAPDSARVERLDPAALRREIPAIGRDVVGATYCPQDGHVNSLRLFHALHEAAMRRGVHYRPNSTVVAIEPIGGSFRLHTASGVSEAGKVVLAAGLDNARLAPMVGLDAPVRPQRGQVMVTEKLAPFLHHPLHMIRQTDEGGVMIGDSNEEVGLDNAVTSNVLAAIATRATRIFPRLEQARIVRSWAALRVMSPDGYPIYDHSRSCPGAYVVTCHSGITLAAAHARIVAAQIAAPVWPDALSAFSAGRFAHVPPAA